MADAHIIGDMPTKEVFGRLACKCQRCSTPAKPTVWLAEGDEEPKRCPRCKSMLWNTPRKQKRGPQPGNSKRKDAGRPKGKTKGQPKRGKK